MGYPTELDDADEKTLKDELQRREQARARGLCDYCGRTGDTPACKHKSRHDKANRPLNVRVLTKADLAMIDDLRQYDGLSPYSVNAKNRKGDSLFACLIEERYGAKLKDLRANLKKKLPL